VLKMIRNSFLILQKPLRLFLRILAWPSSTMAKHENIYQLKDQTCIELGLIGPQDKQRYLNGFKRLSPRTNINRFHTFKTGFTEKELDYLLNIDNVHHLAIGAIDCKNRNIGVGLARYICQQENPDQAEVAITVIDEYQGRGLGKLLYQQLINKAQQNGVNKLRNVIKKDNRAMLHILEQLGAIQISENDQVYELELQLKRPADFSHSEASSESSQKTSVRNKMTNMAVTAI